MTAEENTIPREWQSANAPSRSAPENPRNRNQPERVMQGTPHLYETIDHGGARTPERWRKQDAHQYQHVRQRSGDAAQLPTAEIGRLASQISHRSVNPRRHGGNLVRGDRSYTSRASQQTRGAHRADQIRSLGQCSSRPSPTERCLRALNPAALLPLLSNKRTSSGPLGLF